MIKNIIKNLGVLLLFGFLFYGCENNINLNDSDEDEHIHGSGRIVMEKRNVDECNRISVQNYGDVYLTQDSDQSIRIEADDNILDRVITKEENGILIVGLKKGNYSDITFKIFISLKTIKELSINGAGNITVQNPIRSDQIYSHIIGAGNIILKGSGNYSNCIIDGAGKIDAQEFVSNRCSALVNGAGDCIVYADEQLDAVVNGVGSIYYYGDPEDVSTNIVGIGQIIRK